MNFYNINLSCLGSYVYVSLFLESSYMIAADVASSNVLSFVFSLTISIVLL